MKQYVRMVFFLYKARSSVKEKEKILREKLKQYKVDYGGTVLGEIYKFEYPSEQFYMILDFAKNRRSVGYAIEFINEYTPSELDNAKMFWLRPRNIFMDDGELFIEPCENCTCVTLNPKKRITTGKDVKCMRTRSIFQIGSGIETLKCISAELYEVLMGNGVNSNDFSPITKGKSIKGYVFNPQKECNIVSDYYEYNKCEKCGRILAQIADEEILMQEKITIYDKYDFSEHDVFRTVAYYCGEQQIVISPKIFKLIQPYIKPEEAIPIFDEIIDAPVM